MVLDLALKLLHRLNSLGLLNQRVGEDRKEDLPRMERLLRVDHQRQNSSGDNSRQRLLVLICDVHVQQITCSHLVRLLESLDESQCDVCSKHSLKFVLDAGDHAIQDEWRAVAAHTLLLEVWLRLRLQRVGIGCVVELGEIHLRQLINLTTEAGDLADNLDHHLPRGRDEHIINLEDLGCI